MLFDFLEAADNTPLTKTYRLTPSGPEVEPYPFVRNFNSHRVTANSIAELYAAIKGHAAHGHCMLKGLLSEPLANASRAGKTTADAPTQWVCLDLDFDDGWSSVDDFLRELHPGWADVSYIWQHSASAGITSQPGLRGHVWLLLDQPTLPAVLKQWLQERNLTVSRLAERIQLAASGVALKWPLDITTCQNDKLLYIAPPRCIGLPDPLDERIVLVTKAKEFAPAPVSALLPAAIDHKQQEKINELRAQAGLPKRTPRYSEHGALNILTNPEVGVVTGVRQARGFVYLNINGGDSWAYYFPENNPEILYNFKGEPPVRLRDIAPDFYLEYTQAQQRKKFGNLRPYAFREPVRDTYYNVLYDKENNTMPLLAPCSSKDRLSDFMAQFGYQLPDPIEDWQVEFDPTTTKVIDPHAQWVNLFRPTDYVQYAHRLTDPGVLPPVTTKILRSVCGNDQETLDHFLNWLACLFQTRRRLETAWVFHGVSGTGKGLLLSRILRPLLGEKHVLEWTTQAFEEKYNQPLEQACVLWLDEFKVSDSRSADLTMNKLKNYITEPKIQIRGMRTNLYEVPNYLNIIIACNHPDPVQLTDHDRRFNVAPAQERPLVITPDEIAALNDELLLLASYLAHYPANLEQARRVLLNAARESMIVASQTTTDAFFAAARAGRLRWFLDFLQPHTPMQDTLAYQQFERVMRDWIRQTHANMENGNPVKTTRDDLRAVYSYIVGTPTTPAKFTRMCNIHRLELARVRINDEVVNGLLLPFYAKPDELAPYLKDDDKKFRVIQGASPQ